MARSLGHSVGHSLGRSLGHSLAKLRLQAAECKACPLWRDATQTVFGEGVAGAPAMLVGEQPGDAEDLAGRPFVGPAGEILDRALADARLDRGALYVTNVVKHFKWEPRGKRRLHKTPAQAEIAACRPWLDGELEAVRPVLVICLGATAAHALLGRQFKLSAERGRIIRPASGPAMMATVHPSYILRVPSSARGLAYQALVADLQLAAGFIAAGARVAG